MVDPPSPRQQEEINMHPPLHLHNKQSREAQTNSGPETAALLSPSTFRSHFCLWKWLLNYSCIDERNMHTAVRSLREQNLVQCFTCVSYLFSTKISRSTQVFFNVGQPGKIHLLTTFPLPAGKAARLWISCEASYLDEECAALCGNIVVMCETNVCQL